MPSIFNQRASGRGRGPVDAGAVKAALAVLADPELSVQIQGLPSGRHRICAGNDAGALAFAAQSLGDEKGVYFSLNPCPNGREQPVRKDCIVYRRWLLFDVDPERPKDTNATDAEHDAAKAVAYEAWEFLDGQGWPAPLVVDSGNGWHLLYRLKEPADDETHKILKAILYGVADRFDNDAAKVDRSVHNANRVSKLPGTWARKGPSTPERPHRMARIVLTPEKIEPVPRERLQALVGVLTGTNGEASGHSESGPWKQKASSGDDSRAYARAALEREVARVLLAPVGERNKALNRASFSLGTLVGAGKILRQEVEQALATAARAAGLDEGEIAKTVKSGLDAGAAKPREEKAGKKGDGAQSSGLPPDGESIVVRASTIQPRAVTFLWAGYLPEGKLITFAGQTSQGKTFVSCDIIARLTRGLAWPTGEPCERPGQVLFISGDDDADDTIVPRLIAAGADMTQVCFLKESVQAEWTMKALGTLDRALKDMGDDVRLVVVDPPTSYMGGVDDHKNTELRQLLTRLKDWASKTRVTVILVTHVNKAGANKVEAMSRVMGGVAWVTGVRAAFMFTPDPDDHERQLFVPLKMNLGIKPKGLAYRIVPTDLLARVEWLGAVDTTADDAMNRDPKRKRRDLVATEWLIDRFRDKLEWPSDELFAAARNDGLSRNAVFEAKDHLHLPRARRSIQPNGDIIYVWWVPPDWPPLSSQANGPANGTPGHQDDRDEKSF